MKYKVIKKFEVSYIPSGIFKGQEHTPLINVKGGVNQKLNVDDIIKVSEKGKDNWVKINGILLNNNVLMREIQESIDYYLKEGMIKSM